MSAVLSNNAVLGTLKPGQHGSTFGGNPLACAVARAALRALIDEGMIENAAIQGARFLDGLRSIWAIDRAGVRAGPEDVGDQTLIRGLGTAFSFVRPGSAVSLSGR